MAKKQITIPFFIPHMGCPHRCAFCAQWHTTGAALILEPEDMATKVDAWRQDLSPSVERIEVAFFGGSFTGLPLQLQQGYLEAAQKLKETKLIHAIRLSTRPDYINDVIIDLLKRCSVDTVELGAQSFDEEVLELSRRGHTAHDITHASEKIQAAGIDLVIQLMPGLPGDTREISLQSAGRAAALSPSAVRLYPTVVLKGTELEEMMISGKFTPLTLEEAIEWGADQFALFHRKSIPVIRMGLHPLAPDQEIKITAGPYHTSLGFMIKSRYRRRELATLIEDYSQKTPSPDLKVMVPPREVPEYIGQKRENVNYLEDRFNLNSIAIVEGTADKPVIVSGKE